MMAWLRRWWRRRAGEPLETRLRRVVAEEQERADSMGADRRMRVNARRLQHLRAQIEVYRRQVDDGPAPTRGR